MAHAATPASKARPTDTINDFQENVFKIGARGREPLGSVGTLGQINYTLVGNVLRKKKTDEILREIGFLLKNTPGGLASPI